VAAKGKSWEWLYDAEQGRWRRVKYNPIGERMMPDLAHVVGDLIVGPWGDGWRRPPKEEDVDRLVAVLRETDPYGA
jgi:hypothetical protein